VTGPGAALSASAVSVTYGGVAALADVSIDLLPGAVHGLVGENGAGKSTLMRVLAGAVVPDRGMLSVDGAPVIFRSPRDAHRAGIRMIQQELSLVPALSVAENIQLGAEPSRYGVIDRRQMRSRARMALGDLGVDLDPDMPLERLSLAERQMVEIAKALSTGGSGLMALILDEPTAILSAHESDILLRRVGALKAQGLAILYCSHRLEEIERVADQVTVLRDGARVALAAVRELPRERLIPLMVGRKLERQSWRAARAGDSEPHGPALLRVDRLSTVSRRRRAFSPLASGVDGRQGGQGGQAGRPRSTSGSSAVIDASFELSAGEIVGLLGLVGAGRTELAMALIGAVPSTSGSMTLAGSPHRPRGPRDAERAGVALLPEDRKASALIMHESVRMNMTLGRLHSLTRGGWAKGIVDRPRERAVAERWTGTLGIKTPSVETPVERLSGGNQQKVALARWLIPGDAPLKVLILDEPTRGVDVGARAEIYDSLRDLASGGAGVLVVTSDLIEALSLCDRLLIMREGRLVGELTGADRTAERAAALMVPA
jgi:ABC-type sugar transport system ATPase subunit